MTRRLGSPEALTKPTRCGSESHKIRCLFRTTCCRTDRVHMQAGTVKRRPATRGSRPMAGEALARTPGEERRSRSWTAKTPGSTMRAGRPFLRALLPGCQPSGAANRHDSQAARQAQGRLESSRLVDRWQLLHLGQSPDDRAWQQLPEGATGTPEASAETDLQARSGCGGALIAEGSDWCWCMATILVGPRLRFDDLFGDIFATSTRRFGCRSPTVVRDDISGAADTVFARLGLVRPTLDGA